MDAKKRSQEPSDEQVNEHCIRTHHCRNNDSHGNARHLIEHVACYIIAGCQEATSARARLDCRASGGMAVMECPLMRIHLSSLCSNSSFFFVQMMPPLDTQPSSNDFPESSLSSVSESTTSSSSPQTSTTNTVWGTTAPAPSTTSRQVWMIEKAAEITKKRHELLGRNASKKTSTDYSVPLVLWDVSAT